jgi:hypothetical protein
MKKKGFSPEQAIGTLREAKVLLSQGSTDPINSCNESFEK